MVQNISFDPIHHIRNFRCCHPETKGLDFASLMDNVKMGRKQLHQDLMNPCGLGVGTKDLLKILSEKQGRKRNSTEPVKGIRRLLKLSRVKSLWRKAA